MSMDKNVPEIRFKGFSEEWANKKIGSILGEIKRPIELIDSESYQLVTVKRRNEGVVPRSILKGRNILVKNYFTIKTGDYLISKRQVVHGANGIVPKSLDNAVVSNEYLVVTDSDETTSKFWTYISQLPEMHKLFFVSSYGVDIEKLVFDVKDWKNRTISKPHVTEQKNITDYLQKLYSLISQHQKKHDKLSNIKKAMQERMFPKQGESTPEVRFKGFSGEWEAISLADFGKATSGTSIESEFSIDGKYKVISIGSYSENSVYIDQGIRANLSSKTECRVLNKNDLTMILNDKTLAGNIIGRVLLINEDNSYVYNQRTQRIEPNSEYDSQFLYQLLNAPLIRQKIFKSCQGNTQIYVNWSAIKKLIYLIPQKEEQTKIGSYFQKLDALINQHQQQITKLNNIKRACLNKMFV